MKINFGFSSLLTLLFVYLKLTSVITWSWVWVLSPMWLGFIAVFSLLVFASIIIAIAGDR